MKAMLLRRIAPIESSPLELADTRIPEPGPGDIRSVTCNTRDDGQELLAEAAEIPIRPHTTLYRLEEANRALQDLKADRINGTGVLVVGGTD